MEKDESEEDQLRKLVEESNREIKGEVIRGSLGTPITAIDTQKPNCPDCGTESNYGDNTRIHTDDKIIQGEFSCPKCGRAFRHGTDS